MAQDRTRRQLLRLASAASVLPLAGCASVADQFSRDPSPDRTADTPEQPRTTTSASRRTTADASNSTATGREADDSWSVSSVSIEPPDVSFAGVTVPDERTRYPRLGRADAPTIAILYGNWKCPHTQEFVLNQLPTLVDRFVEAGDLAIEHRSVAYRSGEPFLGPDAPRAARAGRAVWDLDPQSYWSYLAYVFANQPQERHEWAQPALLLEFAEASGVSATAELRRRLRTGAYAGPVRATAAAAARRGVTSVPRIVVDGTVTAPTVDPEATLAQLDSAVRSPQGSRSRTSST